MGGVKSKKSNIIRNMIRAKRLQLLSCPFTYKKISEKEGIGLSTIYRHFYRLKNDDLIHQDRTLTEKGIIFLKQWLEVSENVKEKPYSDSIRLHNIQFKILVKTHTPDRPNWGKQRNLIFRLKKYSEVKQWEIKNNYQTNFYIYNLEVRLLENSVLIRFLDDIYGNTSFEAKNKALNILYELLPKIESRLRVGILDKIDSCNITIIKQHNALICNEIAKLFLEAKIPLKIYDNEGKLRVIADESHGIYELEAVNPLHGEEDAIKIQNFIKDVVINNAPLPSQLKQNVDNLDYKINFIGSIIMNIYPLITGSPIPDCQFYVSGSQFNCGSVH